MSAVSSVTYLVLNPIDLPRLDEWRSAIAERFAGSLVKPVLIGGAPKDTVVGQLQHYDHPSLAASYIAVTRRSSDRVFLLTSGSDDTMLAHFINGGLFPTYIDASRHRPADLQPKSTTTAAQPGPGTARQAA